MIIEKIFNGLVAPEGDGLVVEVHADLITPGSEFVSLLETLGFEDDPFALFHPSCYTRHMTGRLRVGLDGLKKMLDQINLALRGLVSGSERLYLEIELVRNVVRFSGGGNTESFLDGFSFTPTGKFGCAKADIHVEWPAGAVPKSVYDYLVAKNFYWVSTPESKLFGAEQIATLQTLTYAGAQKIYKVLCASPPHGCSAIHLEQKIGMFASHPDLPMPETINVTW